MPGIGTCMRGLELVLSFVNDENAPALATHYHGMLISVSCSSFDKKSIHIDLGVIMPHILILCGKDPYIKRNAKPHKTPKQNYNKILEIHFVFNLQTVSRRAAAVAPL